MLSEPDEFPAATAANIPAMRELMKKWYGKPTADVPFAERRIPGRNGAPDVRIYIVNAKPGLARPALLHTHGGGYILGTAGGDLPSLQKLATQLDAVIVTVDYRLAPETTYTGSIEDNYAGLKWLHDHAEEIGVDRKRIAVGGESAGGGHAALLAIAARDRGEVPVMFQSLVYPMLDDRTASSRPVRDHIGRLIWKAEQNRLGWHAFLGQAPGAASVPVAAVPSRNPNLAGLAPAWIGVGGIDLFVDEDIEYARRLVDAAVPTELLVVPGAFHGFDGIAADSKVAKRFSESRVNALRRAFEIAGKA
jgi:acetyl esterase/lipase